MATVGKISKNICTNCNISSNVYRNLDDTKPKICPHCKQKTLILPEETKINKTFGTKFDEYPSLRNKDPFYKARVLTGEIDP